MAEGDRLGDLQMGEARHDGVGLALGQVEQAVLQAAQFGRRSASMSSRRYRRMSVAT